MSRINQPTRPVDTGRSETELAVHIKKALSAEECAPKAKHVRCAYQSWPSFSSPPRLDVAGGRGSDPLCSLAACILYTWDHHSSIPVWNGIRVQPVLSDEVMTFKSLIVCHKLLQEGHPVVRS